MGVHVLVCERAGILNQEWNKQSWLCDFIEPSMAQNQAESPIVAAVKFLQQAEAPIFSLSDQVKGPGKLDQSFFRKNTKTK